MGQNGQSEPAIAIAGDNTPPPLPLIKPGAVPRTDSKFSSQSSISTSALSHQHYMDSLVPPSPAEFERISRQQEEHENENRRRSREIKRQSGSYHRKSSDHGGTEERAKAAKVIQRTYRGYRTRREMDGFGLDASTRWMSAIREAQYRELVRPKARPRPLSGVNGSIPDGTSLLSGADAEDSGASRPSTARGNWKKVTTIARRAQHDDLESSTSSSSESSLSSSSVSSSDEPDPHRRAELRKRREEANERRKKDARMMGLQYFLEMVDLKHRYGSNLRIYHEQWKKEDTNENFFYWLDYGAGKELEMEACPRDRLEREQVRYLSREERQYYLVEVDEEGRLCWAKNGVRIDTTEQFKDSIHGIVPADEAAEVWVPLITEDPAHDAASIATSNSSAESESEAAQAARYATPEFDNAKGARKIGHLSASTIFNKLLRKSVRKNTWIFVADTSFRLYVGIKSSGAFQHSSFLQGSRISAAGLIKIKKGRLASLSPLSGHYRPPAANFRAFVHNLKEAGADTSHVSISKSYAVLVGLEVYVKTRQKGKDALRRMTRRKDRILAPEEARRRDEEKKDKSKSAAKERQVLEEQRRKEEQERDENRAALKLMEKLHLEPREPLGQKGDGERTAQAGNLERDPTVAGSS
jgi:hypothetical protein